MKPRQHAMRFILMAAFFLAGYAHEQDAVSAIGTFNRCLPENIITSPATNPFKHAKVGVFSFQENGFGETIGQDAAAAVYNDLLKKQVFYCVSDETTPKAKTLAEILGIARRKSYDLVVTGEVLYYFDGSDFTSSKVKEAVRVYHVPSNRLVWFAMAEAFAPYKPAIDCLLFQVRGRSAAPASGLINENAEKFCNMILTRPVQCEIEKKDPEDISDPYNEQIKELQTQNALLEKALFRENEKSKALAKDVETLSAQLSQNETQEAEKTTSGKNMGKD